VPYGNAKVWLDCAGLDTVAVLVRGTQGGHENFVNAQIHGEQGRVHPAEQGRIVGRVACRRGEDARGLAELSSHAVVNRIDSRDDRPRLALRAETEPQHRVEGAVKALRPSPALGAERTVIDHALSHQRVRKLEQDGRTPGYKQDDLLLKLLGYCIDFRSCAGPSPDDFVGSEQY
jgi:hypothetical protein